MRDNTREMSTMTMVCAAVVVQKLVFFAASGVLALAVVALDDALEKIMML